MCRQCFEIYRDSALYRKLWEAGEGRFGSDERLIAAGEGIAVKGAASIGDRRLPHSAGRTPWYKRPVRAAAAIAYAAVALAVSVWLLNTSRAPGVSPDAAALAQVRKAVETATLQGPFIFPGTENMKVTEAPVYRSGYVPLTDSLQAALHRLYQLYDKDDSSREDTRWLIAGYVAVGRTAMARDLLARARGFGVGDAEAFALDGLIAITEGEYEKAEALLREALRADRSDMASAFNLALVLRESEQGSEARKLLEEVLSSSAPSDGISIARARAALTNIESQ